MELKESHCIQCGDRFDYPKHFTPRPRYCAAHDPNPEIAIDLSRFDRFDERAEDADTVNTLTYGIAHHSVHDLDGAQYYTGATQYTWNGTHYVPPIADTPASYSGSVRLGSSEVSVPTIARTQPNDLGGVSTFHVTVNGADARFNAYQTPAPDAPQGTHFADSRKMRSVEELRNAYQGHLATIQQPSIVDIFLPAPRSGKTITIIHLGDIHIGTDACVYDAFKEVLDYILRTPDVYLAVQGDMVDLLTAHSVGVLAEQALTIQDQFTLATADLLPLARARKILWMLRGNHEDRLDKATKNIVDAAQWMARILDVNYLHTDGYTRVHCAGKSYLSYNLHGFNAGGTPGARRNKMHSMMGRFPSADVVTCGHNHHLDAIQAIDDVVLADNRRAHRQRWGLYTGTYHSYIGYPAEQGLGAGPLGCVALHFDIEYGSITPEILPVLPINGEYRHILPRR